MDEKAFREFRFTEFETAMDFLLTCEDCNVKIYPKGWLTLSERKIIEIANFEFTRQVETRGDIETLH